MKENEIFSNEQLKKMIVPLFLEQILVMLVGLADTLIISYAGETAVPGGSLVNQFNTIFIYLFTALASGGAVVISQLLLFSTLFSVLIAMAVLFGKDAMLRLLFGKVEKPVMDACMILIT